jgi:hypothetical protein
MRLLLIMALLVMATFTLNAADLAGVWKVPWIPKWGPRM